MARKGRPTIGVKKTVANEQLAEAVAALRLEVAALRTQVAALEAQVRLLQAPTPMAPRKPRTVESPAIVETIPGAPTHLPRRPRYDPQS